MRRHRDEDAHGRYPGKKQRRRIASDDDEDEDEDEGMGLDSDAAIFALVSFETVLPFVEALIAAFVSCVCSLSLRDAASFALVSFETVFPLSDSLIFFRVSFDIGPPLPPG